MEKPWSMECEERTKGKETFLCVGIAQSLINMDPMFVSEIL